MVVPNPDYYTNHRILAYPDGSYVEQASSWSLYRRDGCPPLPPQSRPISTKEPNPKRSLYMSKKRALGNIQKILDCNHLEYFATLTFDNSKVDRYDPEAVYKKTKNFLDNARRRHDFTYLVIPGLHKPQKGDEHCGIHLHVLCNLGNLPIEKAVKADGSSVVDGHGRTVFHLPAWKYGYSHMTQIEGTSSFAGAYCKKHIIELNKKIFGKWYLASRNLIKGPAVMTLEPIDFYEFRDSEKLRKKEQFESVGFCGVRTISEKIDGSVTPDEICVIETQK